MAKPRVFVSSTYYDLKHIRASLDLFIDSLGFEPVLSEKGDIAYTHDRPLDESCYREAENSDIFVLVVGGRYGTEVSNDKKRVSKEFFERYDSITRKEYESAAARDIPIYILLEKGVHSEYQTYLRNKEVESISYAHVDSVNVFVLIEDILSRPRNNPVQTFERFEEIETWLRDQWAGLFRELLRRQSQQQQLAGLSAQVGELKATNETLKKYLEAVMLGADRTESSRLIESEEQRLLSLRREEAASKNDWVKYVAGRVELPVTAVVEAVRAANGREDFVKSVYKLSPASGNEKRTIADTLRKSATARRDLNEARMLLGLQPFSEEPGDTRFEHEKEEARPSVERAVLTEFGASDPEDESASVHAPTTRSRAQAPKGTVAKKRSPKSKA
ncbi:DUF4062 domain-containing protein [Ramlibacter sp. AN1133]|uniref:DUF4062 domain-containing protein n=1 Tax=Ramlibacter sp. AN1133 TaxID=3133429 RepID=UPI0030C0DA33